VAPPARVERTTFGLGNVAPPPSMAPSQPHKTHRKRGNPRGFATRDGGHGGDGTRQDDPPEPAR
jgi:hypothetical protein